MSVNILTKIHKILFHRAGLLVDYGRYAARVSPYRQLLDNPSKSSSDALLIVSGHGMNILWGQTWLLLSLPLRMVGYEGLVLTARSQRLLNGYFRLLRLKPIYLDDYAVEDSLPFEIQVAVQAAHSLEDYRVIHFKKAPVGQIALSTYSRNSGTGLIDFSDPKVIAYINDWIGRICGNILLAERLYAEHKVKILFFTEVFMEEYGAFYYAAIHSNLNVIRFAGTVRDDAIIVQHLSVENDRIHHSSLDKMTWEEMKRQPPDPKMEAELMRNFHDRYGQKWHRSKRNHPHTQILDAQKARAQLNITPGRKVAVIYSHILYDTLFFFGTDLFKDYAEWLVETTRAAIGNPHIDWLIKVHPSNLWRGEIDTMLRGRYEEERLIHDALGQLPSHVRLISADTKINPFTWFQLADYGITVRGTSGLEMAALGKTVVTAGTGRYEGNGFTVDPKTAGEYLDILRMLHTLSSLSPEQTALAKRYAHAIFVRKPYTLSSLTSRKRFGCKTVRASDDLIYLPEPMEGKGLPQDLARFGEWALHPERRDLLT